MGARIQPHPIWANPAPADESWKFLLPIGATLLLGMALVEGDANLDWPWLAAWLLAALPLCWGIFGLLRARKNTRGGLVPGIYLFASDLLEIRGGTCTVYNIDGLTKLNAKEVVPSTTMESEMIFVFGHEIVRTRLLGRQAASLTIQKFWQAREQLLNAMSANDQGRIASLDPLFAARYSNDWDKICRPPAMPPPIKITMDVNEDRGFFGMSPGSLVWGGAAAVLLTPLLWYGGNLTRDWLAFSRARSRDSVAGWQEYLRRDNPRHYTEAKQIHLPFTALHEAQNKHSANGLRNVMIAYPGTPAALGAEKTLHEMYEQAAAAMKEKAGIGARGTMDGLLRWLDTHHTNVVEIRFTASSAAELGYFDEVIDFLLNRERQRLSIVPVAASLSPEANDRRQAEIVDMIKTGFASMIDTDLLRFEKGGIFSGTVRAFDRPTLAVSCLPEPQPLILRDNESRKYFIRLGFNAKFDLVVPGAEPYSTAFEVSFANRMPRDTVPGNIYDRMIAYAYEDLEQHIATSFFPKQVPERKVPTVEVSFPERPPTGVATGPRFSATGFCVSTDGYVATANHFASRAHTYKVVMPEGPVEAKLVVADADNDLAILKIDRAFPEALQLRPSETVKLGESIATVGFPNTDVMGRKAKIGRGEIASLAGMRDDPKMFQVSVPIQPGNSGGPLLDTRGNVVGIVVAALASAQAVNYAVKSAHLIDLCHRVPDLQILPPPAKGPAPAFEDMLEKVMKATVLIEGYE